MHDRVCSPERDRVKALEREVRELRKAAGNTGGSDLVAAEIALCRATVASALSIASAAAFSLPATASLIIFTPLRASSMEV
jgi:hypothetical protein